MRYDLAIIGSGGGAYAAAIAGRDKGRTVVMIERNTVGGTCVNTGIELAAQTFTRDVTKLSCCAS